MSRGTGLALLIGLAWVVPARAQLEAYTFSATQCAADGGLLRAGFEDRDPELGGAGPSAGGGGAYPGATSLSVFVPDTGATRGVLLYVPQAYDPQQAWPVVLALHGAAGSAAASPAAADAIRSLWSPVAEREGLVVIAPIASGSSGGWVPSHDQPLLACALAEAAKRYNLDLDRRYLWGYSAGAHVAHAVALGNSARFAAYAIKAGVLGALACGPGQSSYPCATVLPRLPRRIPAGLRIGVDDPYRGQVAGDVALFLDAGWSSGADLDHREVAGGHQLGLADIEAAWAFMAGFGLP